MLKRLCPAPAPARRPPTCLAPSPPPGRAQQLGRALGRGRLLPHRDQVRCPPGRSMHVRRRPGPRGRVAPRPALQRRAALSLAWGYWPLPTPPHPTPPHPLRPPAAPPWKAEALTTTLPLSPTAAGRCPARGCAPKTWACEGPTLEATRRRGASLPGAPAGLSPWSAGTLRLPYCMFSLPACAQLCFLVPRLHPQTTICTTGRTATAGHAPAAVKCSHVAVSTSISCTSLPPNFGGVLCLCAPDFRPHLYFARAGVNAAFCPWSPFCWPAVSLCKI